jgi:sulfate adenylyltransferase large subunit
MSRALSIEEFLEQSRRQDMLRLVTAGSVDDGKSTLIGRLLYDANGLYEDQLAALRNSRLNRSTGPIDFSLLTDGLRAEREQGITIDVAYRHFATPRRKFLIADTPGHQQYTRNMATGASTADAAVILVDARNGVLPQSRRHATIAALLGIRRIVVAVNKMDLVGWRQEVFAAIRNEFAELLEKLGVREAVFIPVSALEGDNVVRRGSAMPWYEGPALLEYLESIPPAAQGHANFRFPVQYVNRPHLDFRGYAGQIASGAVKRGDLVVALPSGRMSRVRSITTFDGDLEEASAPLSVTVCLEDELDISRGDMLAHPHHAPQVERTLEADLVWMCGKPVQTGQEYLLKHTTQTVRATILGIAYRLNMENLEREAVEGLELNDIGRVKIETSRPLFFDLYRENRATGSFILIDPLTNETVGAGMIAAAPKNERAAESARRALLEVEFETTRVTPAERFARSGHFPATIWLTGRRELAYRLERLLFHRGCAVHVLADREDSGILPELAEVLHAAGMIVICCAAREAEQEKERARVYAGADRFLAPEPADLPPSDAAAARVIIGLLEQLGVLRRERFDLGEGI